MRQTEMGFEVLRLDGEEGIIVGLGHIIMTQLNMAIGTEIESREVMVVETEHITVFLNGILPLLEVDVSLGFLQTKIRILGIQTDGLDERGYGVTPLAGCLRISTDTRKQRYHY